MLPAAFQESQESPWLGGDTAAPLARVLRETDVMSSPTLQGSHPRPIREEVTMGMFSQGTWILAWS